MWRDYPRELDNFEKLGSSSLPLFQNVVSKTPGWAFFRASLETVPRYRMSLRYLTKFLMGKFE